MILRDMKKKLLQLATKFPVVSVTGPRQSGKSTLIKNAFPTYAYLSFEDPSTRELFQADARVVPGRPDELPQALFPQRDFR